VARLVGLFVVWRGHAAVLIGEASLPVLFPAKSGTCFFFNLKCFKFFKNLFAARALGIYTLDREGHPPNKPGTPCCSTKERYLT
jgi:hypothetical protein